MFAEESSFFLLQEQRRNGPYNGVRQGKASVFYHYQNGVVVKKKKPVAKHEVMMLNVVEDKR